MVIYLILRVAVENKELKFSCGPTMEGVTNCGDCGTQQHHNTLTPEIFSLFSLIYPSKVISFDVSWIGYG